MNIAFFGTPDFAVPSLKALFESEHKIVCIVAQPDKPKGRHGGKIEYCAAKKFGLEHNIPVLQPERISSEIHILDKFQPDIIITCAYGQILKQNVLDYTKYGVVNVHASLLPKYRGSSPIQWAIINGETVTGVTIMQTDAGMDTGDIILQMPLEITANDTAGDLFKLLSQLGSIALMDALTRIESGTAVRTPQSQTGIEPSKYPMIDKECARINWNLPAVDINNMIRGFNPWPVAFFTHGNQMDIRVYKATPLDWIEKALPGTVFTDRFQIFIVCKESVLRIDELQIPGGKPMSAKAYLNGRNL